MPQPFSRTLAKFTAWAMFLAIIALYTFSLWALFEAREHDGIWNWADAARLVQYSSLQALLSAIGSTFLGVLLARAFFYLDFRGKAFSYKLILFAWTLPSLVVIFALIGLWGNAGWLAKFFRTLGFDWSFSLYGLQGILLAHLFLNIPLVTKNYLSALSLIPHQQFRLAAQLGLSGINTIKVVEFPALKAVLPYVFLNVFLVCFTSFPIVLMLGGGPKFSTLEVAIYQAVSFEFDFHQAVFLILVQMALGVILHILLEFAQKRSFERLKNTPTSLEHWVPTPQGARKWGLQAVIFGHSFALFLPMLSVIWAGVSVSDFWQRLTNPILWESALFSLLLSLIASLSAVSIAYLIALEARQLAFKQRKKWWSLLTGTTLLPLILPVFLLAVGLFLLFMDVELSPFALMMLVGIGNGLILLPYIYRLIFLAMWQALVSHDKLAQSLGLTGIRRWWIVERSTLKTPLCNAFALAMASSLGSFTLIAFFGSPDFSTLPYLLYQQLGSYRTEDAAVTALILMLCAYFPFLMVKQNARLE